MNKSLLERSRALNKILQGISGKPANYMEMTAINAENLNCSAFVVGNHSEVGGYCLSSGFYCPAFFKQLEEDKPYPLVTDKFNQELAAVRDTQANIKLGCIFDCDEEPTDSEAPCQDYTWMILPIFTNAGTRRIGTILLCKESGVFSEEDLVLAEYSSVVTTLVVTHGLSERMEEDARRKASVQVALATLSYSEREAIEHIMAELEGDEGLLVASRIADKVGITRSVIVSALRKFESAGVIESRSLGMKGTYIKVLNKYIFKALDKEKVKN